jgi:hypothetical protein
MAHLSNAVLIEHNSDQLGAPAEIARNRCKPVLRCIQKTGLAEGIQEMQNTEARQLPLFVGNCTDCDYYHRVLGILQRTLILPVDRWMTG